MKAAYFLIGTLLNLFSILLLAPSASAEETKTDICAGYEFWFAMPYSIHSQSQTEGWADASAIVTITARKATKVIVESGDGLSMPRTELIIPAGGAERVKIPENMYLATPDNEIASSKGIHISATEPVSVVAYATIRWASESFRVLPAEWLGKKYYTLNLYQDRYGDQLCPAEFVVVATEDATSVTYTPKVATGKVGAGSAKTVTLRKGQTLLVLAKAVDANSWSESRSDLTGSLITANKPVAVISGHTKAAYPQFPTLSQNIDQEWVRNVIFEMMPPVEHCGKEFVIIPFNNGSRYPIWEQTVGGSNSLLRFVAIESGTIVRKAIYNQTTKTLEYINVTNSMASGEFYDIVVELFKPGLFVSNKPVLAGLYNYSWTDNINSGLSQVGTTALINCIPVERWASSSIVSIDATEYINYLYLMFKTSDMDKLYYNGQSLSSKFGSSATSIQGTPYSYLMSKVAPGVININGIDSAKFSAFYSTSYQSVWDARFYASQSDYNYSQFCSDSLIFTEQTNCGTSTCTCKLVATGPDTTCLEFFSARVAEEDTLNYSFTPTTVIDSKLRLYKFNMTVVDPSRPAYAKVRFFTKSGLSDFREYSYSPQIPQTDCTHLDFGFKNPGDSDSCMVFRLVNSQTYPLAVGSVTLTNHNADFSLDLGDITFPLTIGPGESIPISVCARPLTLSNDWIRDTIRIANECFEIDLPLFYANKQSIAQTTDIDFGRVIAGATPSESSFKVMNVGQYSMKIDSMKFANGNGFSFSDELTFPIYLAAGESSADFNVKFAPTEIKTYSDTIRVHTNALPGKLFALLRGFGVATSAEDESGQQMVSVAPSATDDRFEIRFDSPNGLNEARIELIDVVGTRIKLIYEGPVGPGQQTLNVSASSLGAGSGMYFVRVDTNGKVYNRKIVICR